VEVIDKGHKYLLDHLDGTGKTVLTFVSRAPLHEAYEGVTNQEVLRAVIDRVQVLNEEKPWGGNKDILYCLRRALLLHEIRALEIKLEKGTLFPENIILGNDMHFKLERNDDNR
jgi:hypothetical protein